MKPRSYLEQPGIVLERSNGKIKVSIQGNTGCSGCHASLCMLGNSRAKEFEIAAGNSTLSAGEHIMIRINQSSRYAAILYLYLLPFLLMLMTLIGALNLGYTEVFAGIAALLVLIPYFLLVFAGRRKLASHCEVTLERL